jgi:hypothetical protein
MPRHKIKPFSSHPIGNEADKAAAPLRDAERFIESSRIRFGGWKSDYQVTLGQLKDRTISRRRVTGKRDGRCK